MIKKYKLKPKIIEAVQYDGDNCIEIFAFVKDVEALNCGEIQTTDTPIIKTNKGRETVHKGYYVIRETGNNFYLCKPDIFEESYEEVE